MPANNLRTLKVHVPDASEFEITYTDVAVPAELFDQPQVYLSRASNASILQGPTVSESIKIYLDQARHDLSTGTFRQREIYLGKLCKDMGDKHVAELTAVDLEKWIVAHPTWKSSSTRASVIKICKRAMSWLVRKKQIRESPFSEVSKPRDNERRPTTDDEFRRAIRFAAPEVRRILYFMRWTSARPGEVRKIVEAQIDWGRRVVSQNEHKTSKTQKTNKPRLIALPSKPMRLIRWLVQQHKRSGGTHSQLFLNTAGEPWEEQSLSRYWERLRERAKIPHDAKMYGVRHQFGTEAIRDGTPIKDVSLVMGHSSVTMTERYVHLAGDTDHLLKAAERATRDGKKKPRREPAPKDLPDQQRLF